MINNQVFKRLQQVAQSGSLTKAADVLFISRPALVQQVKAAEEKLGFTGEGLGIAAHAVALLEN